MVPRQGDVLDGIGDGGGAGGGGQGACAALQGSHPLFKHVGGGVHEAGVDIALLRQGETPRRLGAVPELIGGGGVNGHGPRVGGGIGGLLPRVDLECLKLIIGPMAASFPMRFQ